MAVVGVSVAAFTLHGTGGRAVASPTSMAANAALTAADSGPLRVVSMSPADGTTQIPSDATVSVKFSVPLSAHSPTPSLTPAVVGTWQVVTPNAFAFVASAPFVPLTTETISIPAGDSGVVSAAGKKLDQPSSAKFTVASASPLRLQQLLAQLGYLPVSFTPPAL